MDPFTLALCVAVAAYVTGAPDRHTLRATRGAAGFVKAGARGAWRHRKAERAKTAAQRAKARKARQDRMWKSSGWGKAAVLAERGAWRLGRWTADGIRHGWAGVKEGRAAYGPAAERATERRDERRAKARERWADLAERINARLRPVELAGCANCGKPLIATVVTWREPKNGARLQGFCTACTPDLSDARKVLRLPEESEITTKDLDDLTAKHWPETVNTVHTGKAHTITIPDKETPVSDAPATNLEFDTLDSFIATIRLRLDHLEAGTRDLDWFSSNLSDAYASAGWGAVPIAQGVLAVEATNPVKALDAHRDAMAALLTTAINIRDGVGEQIASNGVSGNAEAISAN